ncbi:MAG: peptidoglycan DD-metalloendopeptidase family protein [Pseudomonadota bacterium]
MRLALAILFVAAFSVASAQTPAPEELQEIEKALKDRAAEEKRLRREAEARAQEVAALRHRLIETANSIQDAERKITGLETTIAELEIEQNAAETALAGESENLSELLAALQSLEMSKPPALLVSPGDANEAARAAMLLADAAPEVEARARRLREAIARLAGLTETLDAERAAYAATNRDLASRRDVLAELMAEKEKEQNVAESLAAAAQKETARLAVKATSLREMVERLERLAHRVTPRLKPAPPEKDRPALAAAPAPPTIKRAAPSPFIANRPFASARGLLRPPVAGRLTGEFGKPKPDGGVFEGMRFKARDNAIVTAPFEGKVVVARGWMPVGNIVILDVGGGYHILLLGVGAILVEENQRIAAGEPVAQMASENADLDLEIRKNGDPVNPAFWLSKKDMAALAL